MVWAARGELQKAAQLVQRAALARHPSQPHLGRLLLCDVILLSDTSDLESERRVCERNCSEVFITGVARRDEPQHRGVGEVRVSE
jgi:hypothetical protein